MQPQPRLRIPMLLLLTAVGMWCLVLPFVWAHNLGKYFDSSYIERLSLYKAELIVAAVVVASLILLAAGRRLAVGGFVIGALIARLLQLIIGSPTYGASATTSVLLGLTAWRLNLRFGREG